MGTTATYFDMRSTENTHEQIMRLNDNISGELNEKTLIFLRAVCEKNATALEKIITKFVQLQVKLKAEEMDQVIESLYQQQIFPQDMFSSIQYFLADKRVHHLNQGLISSIDNLSSSLKNFDPFKTTIHVLNELNIYIHSGIEKQFLSTLVILMMHFYDGDRSTHLSHTPRRSIDDAKKWIKSLLSISEKSDISKLIDLLADRIQLMHIIVPGKIRDMDLIEIYCLFEDLAMHTKYFIPHDSNKSLLLDIHAMILLALVSNKSPHAFFDVVCAHQAESENQVLNVIQSQISRPLIFNTYFNSQQFKPYFREGCIRTNSNQQAFLSACIGWIKPRLEEHNEHPNTSIYRLLSFFESSFTMKNEIGNDAFLMWLNLETSHTKVKRLIEEDFFDGLQHEANFMNTSSGSLIFVTNKLVSMGFSPKAISTAKTGLFQPLITPHVQQIDQQNLQGLKRFFQQLNHSEQQQLIEELCLLILLPYQAHADQRLKSMAKPLQKHIADQHHPFPALHRIQKAKKARTARLHRKQPPVNTYSAGFFESPPSKIKQIKHTNKNLTRH